ncbi:zinc finger protein 24-like isoform X2 [Hemicordylus capensis]|uniref:zinc finger protein 24-like isoform X2 n=1 Tax=Hemicordylus capensis TaxID=884348 RepID=UPI002304C605|nr:zinc finger protein 24-like isoform X2 [Hemicordylus capensis]
MRTAAHQEALAFGPQFQAMLEHKEESVEQTRSQDPKDFEMLDVEGGRESPCVSQVANPGELLSGPTLLQGSPPKPDKTSLQCWETEFHYFLESEDMQLLRGLTPWANSRAFFASFEQVAVACRWPKREWVTRLLPALSEEADKAFVSLDVEDRADFQKVKAAIFCREALSRDKKRQEFRRFCYQEANGPQEVHAQLRELCDQWLKVDKSSKEQILELVILEQFLSVLPKEMQNWVRERGPDTCVQAVALAEDFLRRLEAADQCEEKEPEAVLVSQSKRKEALVEMIPAQIKAKNQAYEDLSLSGKSVPEYKKADMSKGSQNNIQWNQYGDTKLRARFPGRANTVFPRVWKQGAATEERRRSERLQKAHPTAMVDVLKVEAPSPPSSEAYQKVRKPFLPQEVPRKTYRKVRKSSLLQDIPRKAYQKVGKPSPQRKPPKNHIKTCAECGQSFVGLASLMRHQVQHTGEKRYPCCFCEKGFCWRSDLVRHECLHTGKMPHECAYCGEGFDRKWKREKHEQLHLKSKVML